MIATFLPCNRTAGTPTLGTRRVGRLKALRRLLPLALLLALLLAGCDEDDSEVQSEPGPVEPTFLYVANQGDDTVSVFQIDAGSGALSEIDDSPFDVGPIPYGLAIDAENLRLFVSTVVDLKVATYAIDEDSGAIAKVPGSTVDSGGGGRSLTLHPSGDTLYAGLEGTGVGAYQVSSSGKLSALADSPYTGGQTWEVVADPLGQFLFGTTENSMVESHVVIPGSGALAQVAGSPYATTGQHYGLDVHPDGTFLYVGDGVDVGPSVYKVDRDTGELDFVGRPTLNVYTSRVAMHPSGKFVYLSGYGSEIVKARIKSNGLFTDIDTITQGATVVDLAMDPTGAFLYVSDYSVDEVYGFAIDPDSGELTKIADATATTGSFPLRMAVLALATE